MNESDRKIFLAERTGGIGGSDVPDLLDLSPYGCEKKLAFDKKGIPQDFPFEGNANTRRGNLLEELAIAEFCRDHGYYATTAAAPEQSIHPEYPFFKAHVDRFVVRTGSTQQVVLENKIPNARNYTAIKASGPPDSWVAQLRWNMYVAQLPFGVISVFEPYNMKSLKFEYRRDETLEGQFAVIGNLFWSTVTINPDNPFPQKPEGYAACFTCPWRKTCKGMGRTVNSIHTEDEAIDMAARLWVHDDAIQPYIDNLIDAKKIRKEAESAEEEAEATLDRELDGRSVMTSSGHRAYWKTQMINYKAQPAKPAEQKKRRSLRVIEP